MNKDVNHDRKTISTNLLTEGFITDKFPLLASLGLAGALGLGGELQAAPQKTVNVSNVVKHMDTTPSSQSKINKIEPVSHKKSGSMFNYISQWEGVRNAVYKDHTGKLTIGIGHYLTNTESDRKLIAALFKDTVNYDKLLNGTQKLTNDQVEKLFNTDVKIKEKLASRLIPNYNNFDQDTKNAIVNGLYRGDLGPKTIKHINTGNWKNAAREYLSHSNAQSGPEQIKRRMKTNAALFLQNSGKTV